MHLHVLPVNGDDLSLVNISNCWYLKWEKLLVGWSLEFVELGDVAVWLVAIDEIVVLAEFTVEATNNHNLTFWQLAHTSTLSGCDHVVWVLAGVNNDSLPLEVEISERKLHSFKRCRILFISILNASKDVNKFVVEVCAGMVVSSFIDLGKLHPLVNFAIINFNSRLSLVNFFSRTWNHNVSISDCTARVAMSCEFHLFLFFELELVAWIARQWFEFTALEHAVR